MATLYQKYRPQLFSDLVGQEHITKTIQNEISSGKIAHAYLFFGPRGIGKTTLARLLAKSLNCENRKEKEYEPCNNCTSCEEISNTRHIDVIEIDAASQTGVENVRENIIENAQFRPTKAKYKVFIIDEIHMLSNHAFNALLKTIEEPPKHVIFVLATTELHKLPDTIISRTQRFHFKKIGYDQMLKTLQNVCESEKIKVDKKVLQRIISKSDGALRDAQSLLGQILSLDEKEITEEVAEIVLPTTNVESILFFISNIIEEKTKENFELLQTLIDEGVNLEQYAYDVIDVLRLALISQCDPNTDISIDYSAEDAKKIRKISRDIETNQLVEMIEQLIKRRTQIKTFPIPQLPLELYVVDCADMKKKEKDENDDNNKDDDSNNKQNEEIEEEKVVKKEEIQTEKKKSVEKIKEITKKITSYTNKKIKTTAEQIREKWPQLIDRIQRHNHALSIILKMSNVTGITNKGLLNISVPYSLHKDKLEEHKTKTIIEEEIQNEFKEKIQFCCCVEHEEINENIEEQAQNTDSDINKMAEDFGGEVVN